MKKGFTLLELLAVMIILGLILAITIPSIGDVIDRNREKLFLESENRMLDAAKSYTLENTSSLPSVVGTSTKIDMTVLVSGKYMEQIKDLKDDDVDCTGYVLITKLSDNYEMLPYLSCANYSSKSVADEGLILDMPLGSYASGGTFLDKKDNYIGTNVNVTMGQNRFGETNKASVFNGTTSYVSLPASNSIVDVNSFTISAWFNADTIGTAYNYSNRILTFMRTAGSTGVSLATGSSNLATIMYYKTSAHAYITKTISAGNWYNLVMTYDGITVKAYLNGVFTNSEVCTISALDATSAKIGSYSTSSNFFDGYIDDIKIYNRSLNADEVLHNYTIESQRNVE